jgi:hypothetical protein
LISVSVVPHSILRELGELRGGLLLVLVVTFLLAAGERPLT